MVAAVVIPQLSVLQDRKRHFPSGAVLRVVRSENSAHRSRFPGPGQAEKTPTI
jgi:hypothetical protein